MKKLFFVAALLCALSSSVWATDVLVSSVQIPNFNPTGIGSDRDIAVGVTNGSTTVTSAGQFRQWIGMRGFSLTIQGTRYSVANVVDANTLTLVSGYAGSSSSSLVTATWHKYIEVRLYVNLAFQPLNASYLVQAGTPDSANFYQRFYASVINENGVNKLFINSFTVDATTDAPVNNTAKYTIGFYRPDGSRLDYYKCGNVQQLSIPPTTPTTLSAICTYNQSLVIITDNSAYTKPQIDARFPSCTAGQLYYFAASGNVLSCLNVGTNLSISSGTLNATGGGGGGGGTIGGSGTANRIPLFSDPTTIANSIMSQVGTSEFKFAATGKRINLDSGSQLVVEYANEATTGTLSNRLAKLTGNPSRAILAGTSDTTGLIGVAVANAGTSGSAEIVTEGVVSCEFDGATTAGNYVGASTTTAGKCKDLGASPTGVQIIGRVLSTNGAAGTYSIQVFPGEQRFGGGGSITGSGTTNYLALWNSTSDLGSAPTLLYDAGTDPANPEYLVQDNLHISTTRPIAQLRFDTDQIILSGSATRTNATRMLTLKGKSGQTGDFIRATDSTSTALFGVDNVGNVRIRQLPYTWPAAHTTNGVLTNNGTGTLSWTLPLGVAGPTNAIQINNGGGALDGGSNATLDLLTSTISLGTASSQNGRLLLRNSSNASTTTLQPGAPASSVTFTLPATLPASAGCLQVDNTGVITQTGSACGAGGGSTVWSALTNPSADLSLSMTTRLTTFNWATGTSTNNLFNLTTDASANGTGYLLNVATGASATVKPLSFTAAGTANGVEMTTAGRLQAKGTGRIEATPAGPTNAIQINNGGGLMDGGSNATLDLLTSTISLGTASSQNGRLLLRNSSNASTTTLQPGAPASSVTFTLPATLPASAGCLQVDNTGVITQTGSACGAGGGSTVWSALTNPSADLSLSMTTRLTTFNWATGTSTNNLFNLTTDASANGTGYLLNVATGASATVKPLSFTAAGTANGVEMTTAGRLQAKGTGRIEATPAGATNAIQVNNGGGLMDGGANAVIDLTTSTLSLGTASSQNGRLLLRNSSNANTTTIQPGAPSSSITFTLPATLPASAGCLEVSSTGVITQTGSACGSGGGAVSSVSNANGTLTISPTTGAVVASLNLGNANTWTANQTFGSGIARMTLPQITTGINDANGNGMLLFSPVASAVNAFTFTNSATATKPTNILELTGSDSNVSLHIKTKSSTYPNMGQVYLNTSGRYDRPALSFWDSGFGYLSQYGLGMKGGGSYLSLYAPSIKLGTNEASSGLINMSG
ncbi:MAG TPA: hypothetical protein PKA34_32820, partial [Blastocatellia bacterium]|nr:hypothetical protein [Blastocatellia bacterium]